jgi:hypothetical protein
MANASGRLIGCLLSGLLYQVAGLNGCLWGTVAFALVAALIALGLPRHAIHATLQQNVLVKADSE